MVFELPGFIYIYVNLYLFNGFWTSRVFIYIYIYVYIYRYCHLDGLKHMISKKLILSMLSPVIVRKILLIPCKAPQEESFYRALTEKWRVRNLFIMTLKMAVSCSPKASIAPWHTSMWIIIAGWQSLWRLNQGLIKEMAYGVWIPEQKMTTQNCKQNAVEVFFGQSLKPWFMIHQFQWAFWTVYIGYCYRVA